MSTVLGTPRRPSSQAAASANVEPTPFEILIAIGNILTWLLTVYVIYLHIQARWDLEARYRAHVQAERQAQIEAEKQWEDQVPAENRRPKRKQIQAEIDGDEDWEDEALDWHNEDVDVAVREAEVDSSDELEERMEVMEIPGRQELERDYGRLW
ncbi:uncharacterized protein Z520_02080 [Fonsecaea multimorphosa CBS 102226]|uniref:Uncharacterized protein n=1 Tax=Fonsecaea multimorphosa CBS 102226 TaxID=1442371 RepID=A0A0D2IY48_9EURO|nr:uncharacterized protein Z520_02080 [Fonsecaea multimorphosa CBS 102226]KIY01942.1 hypothetical protein Z520_02080 [Fonsecaea multimorphosa CBS 102226]OAL29624.1 hypothetical protein AYO22_02038 [Fonsecaea multimorphosa]